MEYELKKGVLKFDKIISDLDKFVFDFVDILNSSKIRYVIVSGYVSILFGRSRVTEDIDLFVEAMSKEKFDKFMQLADDKDMWALNSDDDVELYSMLKDNLAIRIAKKGKAIPNFEIKFPKKDTDFFSLKNPLKVVLNDKEILISPLELQIAYKLYLGSEKDIEDAIHVYQIFKEKLDSKLLNSLIEKLNVKNKAAQYGIK